MAALSESVQHKGSDLIYDYNCYFCEGNSVTTEADYYCAKCSKCFCNSCILQHNQIFKNHSALGKEDTKKWPIRKSTIDCLRKCQDHEEETIKLFCKDHSQLCCHTCIALHHRQCSKVTLITDAAKDLTSADLLKLTSDITTMQERVRKLQGDTELSMQALHESYLKTKEEIDAFRKKINDALDELEKTTLKELDVLISKLKESQQADVDHCRSVREQLNSMKEAIKDIGDKFSDLSFIAHTKCSAISKQWDIYLGEKCSKDDMSLIFQCDTEVEEYLSKRKCLGKIAKEQLSVNGKSEHNVKLTDETSCCIRGIYSLPNGQILIADSKNCRVKLFNQKYQVVSLCDLSSSPWDLCHTNSPGEVAVTVDDGGNIHEVQFIEVNNDQLVKGSKLQLPHRCIGIAHHHGDLYVTSGIALYQYTLTGTLAKKLYEGLTGGSRTVYKCAVNSDGSMIFITNYYHHKLLTLSRDGEVLSTFTDPKLQHPVGVHVTAAGQVLVCGYKSNTIIQVNSGGRKKIATLATQKDGLTHPISVHYSRHTGRVLAGFPIKHEILALAVE